MRAIAALLALWLIGLALAPGFIVADFLVERERIDRELCVQRLVPEEVRTCHGQCYLMRSLRSVEQREAQLPDQLRELRLPECVLQQPVPSVAEVPSIRISTGAYAEAGPLSGWCSLSEPVPWG